MEYKELLSKGLKGCGCLSIGFFVLVVIVGIFVDDEETTDTAQTTEQTTEQTEKRDSVIVNEPLEGDPYQELDDLIGLESVKKEVRSLVPLVPVRPPWPAS